MENLIVNLIFSLLAFSLFSYLGYEFYVMLKSHGLIKKIRIIKKPKLKLVK
jgi:hypothetical protein